MATDDILLIDPIEEDGVLMVDIASLTEVNPIVTFDENIVKGILTETSLSNPISGSYYFLSKFIEPEPKEINYLDYVYEPSNTDPLIFKENVVVINLNRPVPRSNITYTRRRTWDRLKKKPKGFRNSLAPFMSRVGTVVREEGYNANEEAEFLRRSLSSGGLGEISIYPVCPVIDGSNCWEPFKNNRYEAFKQMAIVNGDPIKTVKKKRTRNKNKTVKHCKERIEEIIKLSKQAKRKGTKLDDHIITEYKKCMEILLE